MRALVVDDSPVIRELIHAILTAAGQVEVVTAESAHDAFRLLAIEDHASDDLRAVRQDLRRRNEQLRKLLDTIVARPEVSRALQEDFVSLRSERHVIPIRSEPK